MLYRVLAVVLLGFAFVVLVVTFLWIARLMAMRSSASHGGTPIRGGADGEPISPDLESEADPADDVDDRPEAEDTEEDPDPRGVAVVTSSNLGLILGILACLLFKLSPLMVVLSVAGLYYSGGSLWGGIRRYRRIMHRAVIGLLLSVLSVGLHFLELTGQLSAILAMLWP